MMRDLKRSSSDSKDTKKLRKILHEEVRLGINAGSDSEVEERVDLRKELYPLGHYINDREEMIEQMFSLIKGAKLRKMLPPILKDMPLDELKADCLIHLLGMSKKRIYAVLEGRQIDSSSDSESHSDSSIGRSKKARSIVKPIVIKQEGCSDISDNPEEVVLIDPDSCESVISKTKKKSKKGGKREKLEKAQKSKDVKRKNVSKVVNETVNQNEIIQNKESSNSDNDNEEAVVPTGGKNLLEILELEMRARAIRALLHKDGPPKNSDVKNKDTETKSAGIDKDSNEFAAEDSEGSEDNMVTPAKNIRKRKNNSDDVIVVAPKLVTIDLTDDVESNVNNKSLPLMFKDPAVSVNENLKSNIVGHDAIHDKPSATSQISEDYVNKDSSELSIPRDRNENKLSSNKLVENATETEDKIPYDIDREANIESQNNKECELEDGEIVANENEEGDNEVEIIPEDKEPSIENILPNKDFITIQQTKQDVCEASISPMNNINENELLQLAETVILSDDDSSMSQSNVIQNEIAEPNMAEIVEILEDGISTITDGQQITQASGESGVITKEANAKKNWAQRWLESKEVKKVVSTSKLCGSIRKRIKIAKLAKKKSLEENQNENKDETQPPPEIQGSVDEYQLLLKSKTVTGTDHYNKEESKTPHLEDSTLIIPAVDSIPDNTSLNEQVQDVSSTENTNVKDQSTGTAVIETNIQITQQPHTSQNEKDQNHTANTIDVLPVLTMCESSNTTVQNNSDACRAILLRKDELSSTSKSHNIIEESNEVTIEELDRHKTEIITSADTTSEERDQPPTSEILPNEIHTSENLDDCHNAIDKLQSMPIGTSQTTNTKQPNEILDPDQNGPETLEINITDEELEIDGIINDIIDPSDQSIVWSKSKIVKID